MVELDRFSPGIFAQYWRNLSQMERRLWMLCIRTITLFVGAGTVLSLVSIASRARFGWELGAAVWILCLVVALQKCWLLRKECQEAERLTQASYETEQQRLRAIRYQIDTAVPNSSGHEFVLIEPQSGRSIPHKAIEIGFCSGLDPDQAYFPELRVSARGIDYGTIYISFCRLNDF